MATSLSDPVASRATWKAYHTVTRTATYGFLMALPLLALYEVLLLGASPEPGLQVRVGAEVWMRQWLAMLGVAGRHVLTLVVVLIGIGVYLYERRARIPIRPRYFGWMLAESIVYAWGTAILVSGLVGALLLAAGAESAIAGSGLGTRLALSIGAGVHEELLFRVLLVGGLYAVLRRVLARRRAAYAVAAVAGALVFSAVHYIGPLGDVFTLASFTFRFLFGLMLNLLFLWRGFGIAAWTHALYNVMIVLGLLG